METGQLFLRLDVDTVREQPEQTNTGIFFLFPVFCLFGLGGGTDGPFDTKSRPGDIDIDKFDSIDGRKRAVSRLPDIIVLSKC